MISILIVDDNSNKVKNLLETLNQIPEIINTSIKTASDANSGKKFLVAEQFDLLILDLSLPLRFGDDPDKDGGIRFLEELNLDPDVILPFHIIGLTAYEELKDKYLADFNDSLWHLIYYEVEFNTWANKLKNHVEYLVKSKEELKNPANVKYEYDLAVVTALSRTELDQVLKLAANWESFKVRNDHTIYYKGIFKNETKNITVVAAASDQIGLTATTLTSLKLINNFRPKILAMVGIAAGIKNKGNFGDVLVADLTWDYGSGKIFTESNGDLGFKQDPRPLPLNPNLKAIMLNEERLQSLNTVIETLWSQTNGKVINHKLKMIVGPLASGSYVIENMEKVQEVVDQQRKLVGIDMESYGVYYAANFCTDPKPQAISIKSICDFGDENKNDEYQKYAAFTSANFLYQFALKYL